MSELTTRAEALLDQAGLAQPVHTEEDDRAYRRLTDADKGLILRLTDDGLSQTLIAKHLGCAQGTVSRCLREFAGTTHLARRKAEAKSLTVVDTLAGWVKTRDKVGLEAGKTLLQVAGLTEKQPQTNVAVQVIVGQPLAGTPGHEPVINAEAKVVDHNPHNPGASDEVVGE
jgi:hypothetical protein